MTDRHQYQNVQELRNFNMPQTHRSNFNSNDGAVLQNRIRELQEELGITVDVGPRLGEATHDYPGIRVRLVAYGCRILHGAITPVEHDETVWLSPERVWALNWAPADVPLLEPVCAWMQHEAPGPW